MGRRYKIAALVFFNLMLSSVVGGLQAAETVISEGAARDCYASASFSGSPAEGIAACTAALEAGGLSPEDRAATLINRGILKERSTNYLGALDDYNQGLSLKPDLADAYLNRGAVLIKLARYKEANSDLSKAIALASGKLNIAYFDRGQSREHTGDLAGACSDYQQALALQPNYVQAKERLGVCHYKDIAK